jgi:hypothetical protein
MGTVMSTDLVEAMARRFFENRTEHKEVWPTEVQYYREMEAQHGAAYTDNCESFVTDAFRDAHVALAAIEAAGYRVVSAERLQELERAESRLEDADSAALDMDTLS